jgi:hypothetical protein
MATSQELWRRLGLITSLKFIATGPVAGGWNGRGEGSVFVESQGNAVILFHETGAWWPDGGNSSRFRNVFRWTRLDDGSLRLEHLRFGIEHAVYLFDLIPASDNEWASALPHVCREDCYTAELHIAEMNLQLSWSIDGPRKREKINYHYW